MIRFRAWAAPLLLLALIPSAAIAKRASAVTVAIDTSMGTITVALATRQAPLTTTNFLRYVDEHRFDGTTFYRAARGRADPGHGFIQGGIQHYVPRALAPIPHEPTTKTGLTHKDGTISMARGRPGTAMGDFFIAAGPLAYMDAQLGRAGDNAGFAAFGQVTGGMAVVRAILAAPTLPRAGTGGMKGQMLAAPVRIVRMRRLR